MRSGQKVEFEGSIVVLGDVNGGAEVIAGENIVILGAGDLGKEVVWLIEDINKVMK